jgi:hypothetical protein
MSRRAPDPGRGATVGLKLPNETLFYSIWRRGRSNSPQTAVCKHCVLVSRAQHAALHLGNPSTSLGMLRLDDQVGGVRDQRQA